MARDRLEFGLVAVSARLSRDCMDLNFCGTSQSHFCGFSAIHESTSLTLKKRTVKRRQLMC